MQHQNLDAMLAEDQGVSCDLDKVSAKKGTKYSQLTVHLDGGYDLVFFLNTDQSNIVRMLLNNLNKK